MLSERLMGLCSSRVPLSSDVAVEAFSKRLNRVFRSKLLNSSIPQLALLFSLPTSNKRGEKRKIKQK